MTSYHDPNSGRRAGLKRLPPPPKLDRNQPHNAVIRPMFGRKVAPIEPVAMEPICPHECRMIEFGGCDGPCRLMARTDKEEPEWPTPKSS